MSKIDLHLHSTFSDGKQSVREVFELAKRNGVEVVSLTDHDATHHLKEAQQEAERLNLRLIIGTEITALYRGRVLHILGYGFDPKRKALQKALLVLLESRKTGVVNALKKTRLKIDFDDFIDNQRGFFNRWKAIDYLVSKGLVSNREEALAKTIGVKIAAAEITPEAAIKLIHDAGGIAVLAHAFGPKISLKLLSHDPKGQEKIMKILKGYGLDGLECYQPSHSFTDTKAALGLAKRFNLLVTGGTDWHGPLRLTGKGILDYIPYYAKHPGDFNMPNTVQEDLLRALGS